jgi:cell division protein FtsL
MNQEKQLHNKKKKNRRSSILYFLSGGILKEKFVTNHTRMIVLISILLFLFISNRYTCLLKLREIGHLEEELQNIKNQSIDILSELTGNHRLSEIEDMVKKQGLGLESAQKPPYILYK